VRTQNFLVGIIFVVFGLVLVAQGFYDKDWLYRIWRNPLDPTPRIRKRFGSRAIRYLYTCPGVMYIILGTLLIVTA
jgi:hypothetical protein